MKTLLWLTACLLMCACASAPTYPDVITAVGRITQVMVVDTMMPSGKLAVPGGAGTVVSLPSGMPTPAHFSYVIKRNDGLEQLFKVFERFQVGDCVAVWTDKENEGLWHIRLGKAALRPSTACTS